MVYIFVDNVDDNNDIMMMMMIMMLMIIELKDIGQLQGVISVHVQVYLKQM